MALGFFKEKTEQKFIKATIVFTVVTLVFLLTTAIKIDNGELCRSDIEGYYQGTSTDIETISNNNTYYLQPNLVEYQHLYSIENVRYCFYSTIKTNDYIELSVINEEETILGTNKMGNTSDAYNCVMLDSFNKEDLIGLKCNNCDSKTNITLQELPLNPKINTLYSSSGTLLAVQARPINSYIQTQHNCKPLFKTFLNGLLTWYGIIFIMWAFYQGFLFIKNKLMEGWY